MRSSMLPTRDSNNNVNSNNNNSNNNNTNIPSLNVNMNNNGDMMLMMQQMQAMLLQQQQQVMSLTQQLADKKSNNSSSSSSKKSSKQELDDDDKTRLKDNLKDRNELIVFDEEDENGYIKGFLLPREKYFPYDKYKNKYYKTRYTLLSPYGRKMEYIRSLFQFKAHEQLFPSLWQRYYKRALSEAGISGYEKVREVDVRSLLIPEWYVDERDTPIDIKNNRHNDMQPGCYTLMELPEELSVDPPALNQAPLHYDTLKEYTKTFVYQMKLHQAGKPKAGVDDESSYSSASITIKQEGVDSDNDDDREREDNNRSKPTNKMMDVRSCKVCNAKFPCYDNKVKICDECVAVYYDHFDDKDSAHQDKDIKPNINEYKQKFTYDSVLGQEILSRFDDATQQLMLITKDIRTTSPKDLNKARDTVISLIKDFSGDVEKAPTFYYEYCVNVQRYNFLVSDCITILQAKCKGEALSWLTSKILTFSRLPTEKIMPALLSEFRKQYMNATHIETFRSELRDIRLRDHNVTKQDLKVHYESFVNKKNNLRICDPLVTESTFKQMFVESMNSSILMYMGDSHKSCKTVDDVFQLAEEGIKYLNKTQQYQPLADPTVMNAMMYAAFNGTRDKLTPEQRSYSIDMENVTCFHCGKKGHFTYDCRIRKAGVSQNAAGLKAWSTYCSKIGMVKSYDPKYYDTHPPKRPSFHKERDKEEDSNNKIINKEKKRERGRSPGPKKTSFTKDTDKSTSSSTNNIRKDAQIKAATAALKSHTTVDSEDEL